MCYFPVFESHKSRHAVAFCTLFLAATFASNARVGAAENGPTSVPDLTGWINQRFEKHFDDEGKTLPETVNDATFLRRVYLDLAGRIPSISEVRDFTTDDRPNKRMQVIDELLESDDFSEHTARVWRRVLIPPGSGQDQLGFSAATAMDNWLQKQFKENTPYDEVARRLVIAGGAEPQDETKTDEPDETAPATPAQGMAMYNPDSPTAYLLNTGAQPANMASSVSRVFLGVRLECAQCHDHPFTDWKQQDFWGVAAFFSGAQIAQQRVVPGMTEQPAKPVDRHSTSISDEDGKSYSVSLPWDGDDKVVVPKDELPRQYFARWMTSAENPQFSATAVNRVWQHLCGNGLTDSVDDLDQADDKEREVVLDELAKKFAYGGFDTKELIRSICASDFYQRPSKRSNSETAVASRPLKVLTPEQLFDSLEVALHLPISSIDRGPRYNGERDSLVTRMEEAMGTSPDEFRSGIPQALALMNGQTTVDAVDLDKSRALKAILDAPFFDFDEKLNAMFLATLSREPKDKEREKFTGYIQGKTSGQEKAEAFSEIMWALINSPEFVLVR